MAVKKTTKKTTSKPKTVLEARAATPVSQKKRTGVATGVEKAKPQSRRARLKAVVPIPLNASSAGVMMNKQVNGFMDFLREQSVVGLAIGLVLGTQVKQLVDSIVLNFFNPFIGLFLPGKGALDVKTFTLHFDGKMATFGYGAFVMTLLNFILVAAIVYFVFKGLKLDRLTKKKEKDAPDEEEPQTQKKTTRKK